MLLHSYCLSSTCGRGEHQGKDTNPTSATQPTVPSDRNAHGHGMPANLSLQSCRFGVYYRIKFPTLLCKGTSNHSAKIHKHQECDNKPQVIQVQGSLRLKASSDYSHLHHGAVFVDYSSVASAMLSLRGTTLAGGCSAHRSQLGVCDRSGCSVLPSTLISKSFDFPASCQHIPAST